MYTDTGGLHSTERQSYCFLLLKRQELLLRLHSEPKLQFLLNFASLVRMFYSVFERWTKRRSI